MRLRLVEWLTALRDHGPMSDDHIARFCVRRDELAALMRDIDKLALSIETAEALTEFLDDKAGGVHALATAIRDWRKHTSIVRWSFKWEKLPPAVRAKAQRRQAVLVSHAQQNHWIVRDPADDRWRITDDGRHAIHSLEDVDTSPPGDRAAYAPPDEDDG